MPNKYELITTLYRETLNEVSNPAEWQKFLRTAGYNFRLDFDDLILLYAQKPESTAVLEIEKWNNVFGRWVNKGSTGIAFFDKEKPGSRRLRYFFDISDTHEARFARPVPTWKVLPEFEETITETLENAFGELVDKSEFGYALLSAAKNAVEDNMSDYFERLEYYKENSFLEDLDELNLKVTFREALQNSIGYMLLSRCGVDTEKYFTDDDFRCVKNFSTVQTLNVLGTATGDISQMCLDSISKTVLNLQKQAEKENRTFALNRTNEYPMVDTKRDERRNENGNHIQNRGRLQNPEPSSDSGAEISPWEIRITPPQLSSESQKNGFHQPSDNRETEQPSGRDSENSRCLLFIRGESPIMDDKYDIFKHPNISYTPHGGGKAFEHGKTDLSIGSVQMIDIDPIWIPYREFDGTFDLVPDEEAYYFNEKGESENEEKQYS